MPNLRGIPGKPWRPIARTSNYYYYYPAHAQRMRRSVTDIYIYIYIYPSREPSAQSNLNNNDFNAVNGHIRVSTLVIMNLRI